MIAVITSIFALIAAITVAYLLTIIDSIVHGQLYQFGLSFSYDWANSYWMVLRISLALLGLIAAASSVNITHFVWRKLKSSEKLKETERIEAVPMETDTGVPTLFKCSSCGRSITHPLRMLDFQSQRPKMINICPFCNATVVPLAYASTNVRTPENEEEIKSQH
jgi:hypothetical protein